MIKFDNLTDLASYLKTIHPKGYRLNTVDLTLAASLSTFEINLALEMFGAIAGIENEAVVH